MSSQPIKKKHPGGRPTKYTPELIRKTEEYLENWKDYGHKIPTMSGLSQVIDVTRERIAIWRQDKNKQEFSRMISRLMSMQETQLLDNGLDGTFNPSITKLVLSKHGYHDNPQANQAATGIQVTVNRGIVKLETAGQTLTVDASEQVVSGETLDHKP